MKKLITSLFSLCLLMSLSACAKEKASDNLEKSVTFNMEDLDVVGNDIALEASPIVVPTNNVYIIMGDVENHAEDFEEFFEDNDMDIVYKYDVIQGYAIQVPASEELLKALEEFANNDFVYSLEADQEIHISEANVEQMILESK